MPLIIIPLVFTVGAAVLLLGVIGAAVYDQIKEAIERGKKKALGMPQPPPGYSKKDMRNAAKKLGLKYKYYNFGFCGPQGAGKSTLINSLRNLPNCRQTENWTHDIFLAAPTGEKETTIETNQYGWRTDNAEIKYLRLWDSPGCGTINNRTETYFADRYLYVFDCLIMVTSGSLGEYELKILNDAGAYKRPVVIVLSQSELKAESKARDYYDRTNLSVDEYKPICDETSNEAKENMLDTILKARPDYPSLDVSSVFVVSAVKFRDFLKTNSETDALLSFETSKLLNYLLKEAEAKRIV